MLELNKYNAQKSLLVFGANIRKARELHRFKIGVLARAAEYDRGCLSALEYGEQNPRYETAVRLARSLDTPFPSLFSRNFMYTPEHKMIGWAGDFQDDRHLLVFIENFKRELQIKGIKQADICNATELSPAFVNRILKGQESNPTIRTLAVMASALECELSDLFSRHMKRRLL